MCNVKWDYYRAAAEKLGEEMKDGQLRQSGFSLLWFYDRYRNLLDSPQVSSLLRAYLGLEEMPVQTEPLNEASVLACLPEDARPYPSQVKALANALVQPMTIVQGPPGTGKTAAIRYLLRCIRHLYPEKTVAVVSSNREAIQNIVDSMPTELQNDFLCLGSKQARKTAATRMLDRSPALFRRCWDYYHAAFRPSVLREKPIIFSTIHSIRQCILLDGNFQGLFDYVIVDECSQVSNMVGLVALSCARQIVLFGDDEQLPPVYASEKLAEVQRQYETRLPSVYLDREGSSFMKTCRTLFEGHTAEILLDEHFRCHPAIIGFCNQYVYGSSLKIRTPDDGRFPIRVRWYEGDYYENRSLTLSPEQSEQSGKVNFKQIESFLQEELPDLMKRIEEGEVKSACVISPYRLQLLALKKELEDRRIPLEEDALVTGSETVNELPRLTIHKSQGREYDVVYLMPVEDCDFRGRHPWSQRRRMVNVAVSRAKKELCVLTSTVWFPMSEQRRLTGYAVLPEIVRQGEEENLFIMKLLQYVSEHDSPEVRQQGFGLQPSALPSVFGKVPYFRRLLSDEEIAPSAPECCVLEALRTCPEIASRYRVVRELPLACLKDQSCFGPEQAEYASHNARLDIALIRENRLCLALEVDGAYHRIREDVQENDRRKEELLRCLPNDFISRRFLRLTTDGTGHHEMEQITAMLAAAETEDTAPELTLSEVSLHDWEEERGQTEILSVLHHAVDEWIDHIGTQASPRQVYEAVTSLSFEEGHVPDYRNRELVMYYLLRYGMAYAFEYTVMYQIALSKLSRGLPARVVSFGCGPMIDAVSLALANQSLAEHRELTYTGVDIVEWPVQYQPDPFLSEAHRLKLMGMEEYFITEEPLRDTVFFFPKILSENIDGEGEVLRTLTRRIRSALASYEGEELVLCISHRKKEVPEDMKAADRVVQAFVEGLEAEGKWQVSLDDFLPQTLPPSLQTHLKQHTYENELIPCTYANYTSFDEHLLCADVDARFAISPSLQDFLINGLAPIVREGCDNSEEVTLRYPIKYVDHIGFQILHLCRTRREDT